jgi:hypothetical protein
LTIYLERILYEKAENLARILGTSVEKLIEETLSNLIEEFESKGYKLDPYWKRRADG